MMGKEWANEPGPIANRWGSVWPPRTILNPTYRNRPGPFAFPYPSSLVSTPTPHLFGGSGHPAIRIPRQLPYGLRASLYPLVQLAVHLTIQGIEYNRYVSLRAWLADDLGGEWSLTP